MTTRCHSVRSWRLPSLSFQFSDVATRRLTTSPPLLSERLSGSSPRLPTNMTLLTPAMTLPSVRFGFARDDKRAGGAALLPFRHPRLVRHPGLDPGSMNTVEL